LLPFLVVEGASEIRSEAMRSAKVWLSSSLLALLMIVALVGCNSRPNGADDIADEVGKALDPDPDYVDEPAREPQKPQ
jgi:hypothetical protein